MKKDGLTELAVMLKNRAPKAPPSMTTGTVLSAPPSLRIQLNDVILLGVDRLVVASHLLPDYRRQLKFVDPDWGVTSIVSDGGQGASAHKHTVNLAASETPIEWTDTLTEGDEVILMPSVDGQLYYVLDKAVRLE